MGHMPIFLDEMKLDEMDWHRWGKCVKCKLEVPSIAFTQGIETAPKIPS